MGCSSSVPEHEVAKSVVPVVFSGENAHGATLIADKLNVICTGLEEGRASEVIQALLELETMKLEIADPFTPAQRIIKAMKDDARGGRLPERFYVLLMRLLSQFSNAVVSLDLKREEGNKQKTNEDHKKELLETLNLCNTVKGNQQIFQVQFGYYLDCCQTAIKLLEDNHQIDWGTHIIDIVQTASALTIGIGENKLGALGSQLFDFIKDKAGDEMMRWWYLPVLEVTAKKKLAMKELKVLEGLFENFKVACEKKFNWRIIHCYLSLFQDAADRGQDPEIRAYALDKLLDPTLWTMVTESENKEELLYSYTKFSCSAYSDEIQARAGELLKQNGEKLANKDKIKQAFEIDAKSYTADYQIVRMRLEKHRKEKLEDLAKAFDESFSPSRGTKTEKDPESAAFDLEKEVFTELLKKDDRKVMLITGAEKAGKTNFGAHLEMVLLKEYSAAADKLPSLPQAKFFPIMKDLTECKDPVHSLIEDIRKDFDLVKDDHVWECMIEYPILLILDNYSKVGEEEGKPQLMKNLHESNKLAKFWPKCKIIILAQSDKVKGELIKRFAVQPKGVHAKDSAEVATAKYFVQRAMVPVKLPAEGEDT